MVGAKILITYRALARGSWRKFLLGIPFSHFYLAAQYIWIPGIKNVFLTHCGDFWEVSLSIWGKKNHHEA